MAADVMDSRFKVYVHDELLYFLDRRVFFHGVALKML